MKNDTNPADLFLGEQIGGSNSTVLVLILGWVCAYIVSLS